ncbi:hypothetical protein CAUPRSCDRAFT_12302 [Caulochytrium protostelioides]|uniref:Uncharacterized protein n=1 Tax=Caulochytrium protostelioides TaxID=1555241 RepID=A0A4P9WXJ0_9FUNG|nr:hypothetical protein CAUPRSCDRAFT_12302 [Caulochytrium protostelioides]
MNPAIAAFRQADEENFVLRGMLQTMSARERAQSSTDLAQSLASLVVEKRANVVSPDVADQACDTSDLMGELCPPVAAPVVVAAPTVAATSAPAPTPLPETSTNVPSGAAPQAVEVACGPDRPIARFVNDYVMVDIPDPAVALLEASTARVAMLEDALAMASERHATATATAAATLQAETARWAEEKRVVSDDCLRKLTASTRQAQDATSKLHTLRGEMETMRVALDDATRTRDELRAMAVTASRNERESHVEQARLTQHVATLTADLGQSASALAQSKERLLELGATLETQVRTTNALMEAKQALEEALAASREQLAVYEARIGTLETAVAAIPHDPAAARNVYGAPRTTHRAAGRPAGPGRIYRARREPAESLFALGARCYPAPVSGGRCHRRYHCQQ